METIIIWDLDPEMVRLWGVLPIKYYSIFFASGLGLAYFIVRRMLICASMNEQALEKLAFMIFVGTVFGARIGHCLFYDFPYFSQHPLEIFLPFRFGENGFEYTGYLGLASHGGALGVLLAILYFCYRHKLNLFFILDRVVIGGALAAVFIRIGNFMNSEIIGNPTHVNYGVIFKRVDDLPRHPAQLYEAFTYFIIFWILFWLYKKIISRSQEGFLFGLSLVLIFSARFMIEFVKQEQVAFEKEMFLNMGQLLSLPLIFTGLLIVIIKWRSSEKAKTKGAVPFQQ